MRKTAIAIAAFVALAMSGCGADAGSPESQPEAASQGSTDRFAGQLAQDMDVDYDPLQSPAAAVDQADLIVRGTLVRVETGLSIKSADANLARRYENKYVTLVVTVDKVLHGDAAQVTGGSVYVQVAKAPTVDTAALAEANPRPGIVLVLQDIGAWRPLPDTSVLRPAIMPAGAPLFTAFPDGLWMQGSNDAKMVGVQAHTDELAGAWGAPSTLDQFTAAIERGAKGN